MTKSQLSRLGLFETFTVEQLRGTPFWTKRETITAKQLQNKPAYRTLKLMAHMAKDAEIPTEEFSDFYQWILEPITELDAKMPAVKRFQRTYGTFKQQRLLLTARNAMDLYLKTKGANLPNI